MARTIGNPLSFTITALRDAFAGMGTVLRSIGGLSPASIGTMPEIRRLGTDDLEYALRRGFDDFTESRSDAAFLVIFYPVMGLVLVALAVRQDLIYLAFPALAGFALLGPVLATGLYEVSRRREAGLPATWLDAASVFRLPTIGAVLALGLVLLVIFMIWLALASALYGVTVGRLDYQSAGGFAAAVFGTAEGWVMIVVGIATGALFAVLVLGISMVSFPLLVDREASLAHAVLTSLRVALVNPAVTLTWGVIVAGTLLLSALPLLLGLLVAMPVLGHATWHLYRRAVVAEPAAEHGHAAATEVTKASAERPT